MFDRIIVPLDGSEFSRVALPYALAVARGHECSVELVSSIEPGTPFERFATGGGASGGAAGGPGVGGTLSAGIDSPETAELIEMARRERESELRAIAAEAAPESRGSSVSWAVLEGVPSDTIAYHVDAVDADLVVMSTHGRGGIQRAWLGSVADRLVRRLAVPMLLVRPSEEAPGSRTTPAVARILVPLDGSPLAESILQPAGELALHLGAAVVLLRVLETGAYLGTPYLPEVAEQHEEHIEAVERQSKEYLDDVARRLEARGVDVADTLLRSGAPAAVIEEVARHTAELIAMATHGRGGVQRLLLGSVSDKVLRGGTQPLLLLRPDEERPDEERPGEEPGAREPAP